jgi:hypothetical protein
MYRNLMALYTFGSVDTCTLRGNATGAYNNAPVKWGWRVTDEHIQHHLRLFTIADDGVAEIDVEWVDEVIVDQSLGA